VDYRDGSSKTSVASLLLDTRVMIAHSAFMMLQAGGQVLKSVGGVISRMVRDTDIAARFGGDEFILMLPSADLVKAEEIGQRLGSGVNQATLEIQGVVKKVAVNIGLSTCPRDGDALSELVQEANRAMYRHTKLRRHVAKG
jgi:diguanylate cyclase (GGDEF)-like protein